jgi:hypothetical protein
MISLGHDINEFEVSVFVEFVVDDFISRFGELSVSNGSSNC